MHATSPSHSKGRKLSTKAAKGCDDFMAISTQPYGSSWTYFTAVVGHTSQHSRDKGVVTEENVRGYILRLAEVDTTSQIGSSSAPLIDETERYVHEGFLILHMLESRCP